MELCRTNDHIRFDGRYGMKDYNNLSKVSISMGEDIFSIMKDAYDVGYDDAMEEAKQKKFWDQGYNAGLKDAWELARDVIRAVKSGISYVSRDNVRYTVADDVILNISVDDILEVYKRYNQKDNDWAGYTE